MIIEMKNVKLGPLFDAIEIVPGAALELYEPASDIDYTRVDATVFVPNEFARGQLQAEYSRQLYIDVRGEEKHYVQGYLANTSQATQPLD